MSAIVTDNPKGNGAEEFCNVTSDKKIVAFVAVGAISLACIIALVVGILPRLFGG